MGWLRSCIFGRRLSLRPPAVRTCAGLIGTPPRSARDENLATPAAVSGKEVRGAPVHSGGAVKVGRAGRHTRACSGIAPPRSLHGFCFPPPPTPLLVSSSREVRDKPSEAGKWSLSRDRVVKILCRREMGGGVPSRARKPSPASAALLILTLWVCGTDPSTLG